MGLRFVRVAELEGNEGRLEAFDQLFVVCLLLAFSSNSLRLLQVSQSLWHILLISLDHVLLKHNWVLRRSLVLWLGVDLLLLSIILLLEITVALLSFLVEKLYPLGCHESIVCFLHDLVVVLIRCELDLVVLVLN